jgi:hypothetical protein
MIFLDLLGGGTGNPAKNKKYFLFFILNSIIHQWVLMRYGQLVFKFCLYHPLGL